MPKYRFVAVDQKGKEYSGSMEAGDEAEAQSKLRDKGLFPTSVTPDSGGGGGKKTAAKGKKKAAGKQSL
ncbi:MAG: type II secretion system F family protein, partial [Kiritimatiellae bacterium]|nr:type II secretion system F family protein [Kiritimatiellia bacterium]